MCIYIFIANRFRARESEDGTIYAFVSETGRSAARIWSFVLREREMRRAGSSLTAATGAGRPGRRVARDLGDAGQICEQAVRAIRSEVPPEDPLRPVPGRKRRGEPGPAGARQLDAALPAVPARPPSNPAALLERAKGPGEGRRVEHEDLRKPRLRNRPGDRQRLEKGELSDGQIRFAQLPVVDLRDGSRGAAQIRADAREWTKRNFRFGGRTTPPSRRTPAAHGVILPRAGVRTPSPHRRRPDVRFSM